jgi:hypothetical protein
VKLLTAIALAASVSSAYAQSPITNQTLVLNCLANIGEETSWPECRGMMFAPCQEHAVGTDTHGTCLLKQKQDWENEMSNQQETLIGKLTLSGNSMLAELMGNWFSYREARCTEVAAERPGAETSAKLGCEVAEIAGITAEFQACLEGRSTTPYCTIREE